MAIRRTDYHRESLEEAKPVVTIDEAFKDDEVVCVICGRGGMKTLARHLNFVHNLKPGQYRKLLGIKGSQMLTSRKYSDYRKQLAAEKGSADSLPKAREARSAALLGQNERQGARAANTTGDDEKRSYRRLHVFVGRGE